MNVRFNTRINTANENIPADDRAPFRLLRPAFIGGLFFFLVLVFTFSSQRALWECITDDAFISFRYVERLISGQGLTFNAGEAVEGFSNPLWVLWLAADAFVSGDDVVLLARAWGLAFFLATFLALGWFCAVLTSPVRERVFLFVSALLLLTPGVQVYATLGLEVPQLMFLLVLGSAATAHTLENRRREKPYAVLFLFAAVCFGLVGLSRPEGILYVALWGISIAFAWRVRPFWLLALGGGISTAPFAAYEAFRLSYYGAWLPNTAIAKSSSVFGDWPLLSEWAQWMPTTFGLVAVILALGVTVRGAKHPVPALQSLVLAAAGALVAGLVFQYYAGTDWMLFGRFIVPVWPLALVCLCACVEAGILMRQISPWRALSLRAVIIAASFGGWMVVSIPFLSNQGTAAMLMRGGDSVRAAQWLAKNFPEPLTVGTYRLGAVSYYAPQHTFFDFLGLTDKAQALAVRAAAQREKEDAERNGDALWRVSRVTPDNPLFMAKKPDIVLAIRPDHVEEGRTPIEDERDLLMQNGYTLVRSFRQGNSDFMDIWVKKTVLSARLPAFD